MSRLLVANIVGTRPQLIKAAPVSRALAAAGYSELLVNTGQHTDPDLDAHIASGVGLRTPDVNLGVGSASHGRQTARMLERIEAVLLDRRPSIAITYGDTNSTAAAVLAATKLGIPTAHVEAGLRSFDRSTPEELNRIAADHLSDLLLAPTTTAMEQLAREGLADRSELTGDVMVDALTDATQRPGPPPRWAHGKFYVATVHRAENTDTSRRLSAVVAALDSLDAPVHLLVHPRLAERLGRFAIEPGGAVVQHPPLPHAEMLAAVATAGCVVTDSGGLQKEAFLLGTPCVTLRPCTEWPETLTGGWNVLAGEELPRLGEFVARRPAGERGMPFGDGNAAPRIVAAIERLAA